ncbi:CBS domain-containing protein [Candidatus Woesearchaeota archaeon]|nr:CBS domain-containing protein [Candidatus Woesearchaeota archaeon]
METGIKVLDAMTKNPVFIAPEITLGECASIMAEEHVGAVIVKDNGSIGVITEQDIVRKVVAKGINPVNERVRDYMESDLITIAPNEDIFDAIMKMRDENIRHLPVIENGVFVGLLTLKDVLSIEPMLFELLVEKFDIREAERKPINRIIHSEGICQLCGEYAEEVEVVNDLAVCPGCK